jgi:hypothetical protein
MIQRGARAMEKWRAERREKIERTRETERLKSVAAEEARRKAREAEKQSHAEKLAKERAKKLAKFKCHICGVQSSEPYVRSSEFDPDLASGYEYTTDWDLPGDLYKCATCKKWACKDDYDRASHKCLKHA